MAFRDDFCKSIGDFELIRPSLQDVLGAKVVPVEGQGELAQILDMRCGIDYLAINSEGVRGIAARTQEGKVWRTFTIRYGKDNGAKTEYEKRMMGIRCGYLYPYWTVQAYLGPREAICGVVRTQNLYSYASTHEVALKRTTNAQFMVVPWDEVGTTVFRVEFWPRVV